MDKLQKQFEDLSGMSISDDGYWKHYASFLEQRLESDYNHAVKYSLPNPFADYLNQLRIKEYLKISKRYVISEQTVRDLFDAGIEWYREIVKKELHLD